jgi:hypothetical protein
MTLDELISQVKSDNPDTRTAAWQGAGQVGAPAVKPLAKLVADGPLEVGRAAKRAMFKIVRTVGAPEGKKEDKDAVVNELAGLLGDDQPVAVRRDVLWMLSEIACCPTADKVARLLENKELREDARCCLQRVPGPASLAALKAALEAVPDDFKPAVAAALRVRGEQVSLEKYPDQKLVPAKKTGVQPAGR